MAVNRNKTQRGSVLLISLAILVVLTLMTFAISNSVLLQDKVVVNHRDAALSQQTAESALRDAEKLLTTQEYDVEEFTFSGEQGLYRGFCGVDSDNSKYKHLNEWINEDDEEEGIDHECLYNHVGSYLRTIANENPFTASYWSNAKSRQATTAVSCPFGDNCPCPDSTNGNCSSTETGHHFELGRYQIILVSVDFPFDDISDAKKITMIDNQYQSRTDKGESYFLYKIIATGTGRDTKNRQVLNSYFTALAP